jgi:hypothetical protein
MPPIRRRLGEPLPHQLADRPQATLIPAEAFIRSNYRLNETIEH